MGPGGGRRLVRCQTGGGLLPRRRERLWQDDDRQSAPPPCGRDRRRRLLRDPDRRISTDEYRKYEALRSAGGPDAAAQIDALRRKYSFSWKEQLPWDTRQILIWFGAVAAAFILGVGLSVFAAAVIPGALVDSGFILGASLLCGLLIGVIASLPPTRPSARTPAILALLAILAFNLIPIVAALGWPSSLPNPPSDPLGIWAAVWGAASFAMLLGVIFAPTAAGAAAR